MGYAGMERDQWGSDVPISAPLPRDEIVGVPYVDLGGFVFTVGEGMGLPITSTLHEERYAPEWAPQRGRQTGKESS